ncbi:hypothetical protein [Novipirellula artificiosorum]|uniref:Uncharacterized protein n=1 Tax=Novipirellula artificiosorum TaxID=2528016 RepID=A0A5C6CWE0_9BACT|nr:hypothetical protein [Novipirellula artificiosorum]TWU28882.1 hypothetical protein Poly41_68330 [Novipirellula artificiosorum]
MVGFIPNEHNALSEVSNVGCKAVVEIVSSGQVLHVKVAGNIESMTGSVIGVAVDRQVRQHGRVCVLFEIHQYDGCEAIALWQDNTNKFKVQSIDHAQLDEAKIWLGRQAASCSHARRTKKSR